MDTRYKLGRTLKGKYAGFRITRRTFSGKRQNKAAAQLLIRMATNAAKKFRRAIVRLICATSIGQGHRSRVIDADDLSRHCMRWPTN